MTTAPKTILTVAEFCAKHGACPEGRNWALANCKDMPGAWAKAKPDWLLWIATRPGVLTDKDARLFACWCVRQVWHLLKDERSKRAVRVAERFAMGKATKEELAAAKAAAWAAASDAAWDSARAAAWAAAWAAAREAAWAAAWAAAREAAREAVWDAAGDAQATYLRKKCKPNFGDTP
jgi:hypothetical protein